LEHAVHLELLLGAAPAVLIVDGSTARLQTLAAKLAEQSRRAHLANTSLIAVDWLNGRSRDIAVAMVGDNIAGTTQTALLSYLGDEFPDIHRVLLDCEPTAEALRRMLDCVESEVTTHAPWRLDEI
jgi:hypothetical protein